MRLLVCWRSTFWLLAVAFTTIAWLQDVHAAPLACERLQVGVIRWDAWRGDESDVGATVELSLGAAHWKSRWPLFYTETDGDLDFEGATAAVVASENEMARAAGLSYWAFVFYGRGSALSEGLNQYLMGSGGGLEYALIVETRTLDGPDWPTQRAEILTHLTHDRYLRDESGSPVLFILLYETDLANLDAIAHALALLSDEAMEANAGRPSLVVMSRRPESAATAARRLQAPRISSYAFHAGAQGGAYRDLAAATEMHWEFQASTGLGVVPIIMTGWDPRPLIEHPPPWGSYPEDVYYEPPTAHELRDHVRRGVLWAERHPSSGCTALIYAWNEFAEGGWLAPTLGDPTSRLTSVREAIDGMN